MYSVRLLEFPSGAHKQKRSMKRYQPLFITELTQVACSLRVIPLVPRPNTVLVRQHEGKNCQTRQRPQLQHGLCWTERHPGLWWSQCHVGLPIRGLAEEHPQGEHVPKSVCCIILSMSVAFLGLRALINLSHKPRL